MAGRISLDVIQIASPCDAAWADMIGDDRRRLCEQCKLHVYNIAELTRTEAEDLINRDGPMPCVRLYRRRDGTVLTRDCPVGVAARAARWVGGKAIAAAVLVVVFIVAPLAAAFSGGSHRMTRGSVDRSLRRAPLIGSFFDLICPSATAGTPAPPPVPAPPPAPGPAPGSTGPSVPTDSRG